MTLPTVSSFEVGLEDCARTFGRGSRRASPIGLVFRVRLPKSFVLPEPFHRLVPAPPGAGPPRPEPHVGAALLAHPFLRLGEQLAHLGENRRGGRVFLLEQLDSTEPFEHLPRLFHRGSVAVSLARVVPT